MASYQPFTSARLTEPDPALLLSQLKALDASAGVQHELGTQAYVIKKATGWSQPQINAVQNVIDTAPAATPQTRAQTRIDSLPISEQAIILTLLDQINVLRAALPVPLPAITPAQALSAIRAKAGSL